MELKTQARLRLVKSEHLDLCSSYSFNAASPLGSDVRSCSISLTEEGARPTKTPISASVSPSPRRSDMRDAHVLMPASLREPVATSQRLPVTVVRNTMGMPRPKELPTNLDTVGARVRWWREHRKIDQKDLAKSARMAVSTLSDLENDRQHGSRKLHLIAARLRLNAHYLETGKGEPESEYAQEAPAESVWPFPAIPPAKFDKLNMIERKYAEDRLQEALADIETERRKSKRAS